MIAHERRPTAQELAAQASEPMQIAGKPATQCPKCGCAEFARHCVKQGTTRITAYVNCRNCGQGYLVSQAFPVFVREVERKPGQP